MFGPRGFQRVNPDFFENKDDQEIAQYNAELGIEVDRTEKNNIADPHAEIGEIVCFCFRRMTQNISHHMLNRLAYVVSQFIHCEVCTFDPGYTSCRTLTVTAKERVAVYRKQKYKVNTSSSGQKDWEFVYIKLTPAQVEAFTQSLNDIIDEHTRQFNNWLFYCFCCANTCFFKNARTCAEVSMQVIADTFEEDVGSTISYTPDNVYEYVKTNLVGAIVELFKNNPNNRNRQTQQTESAAPSDETVLTGLRARYGPKNINPPRK